MFKSQVFILFLYEKMTTVEFFILFYNIWTTLPIYKK